MNRTVYNRIFNLCMSYEVDDKLLLRFSDSVNAHAGFATAALRDEACAPVLSARPKAKPLPAAAPPAAAAAPLVVLLPPALALPTAPPPLLLTPPALPALPARRGASASEEESEDEGEGSSSTSRVYWVPALSGMEKVPSATRSAPEPSNRNLPPSS